MDRRRDRADGIVPADLLDQVVAYFSSRRVIVFGSRARGDGGPDSDIDLLVIVDDDTPPRLRTLRAGQEARRGYAGPADIIPVREHVYRTKARIAGTLAHEIAREGLTVYERS